MAEQTVGTIVYTDQSRKRHPDLKTNKQAIALVREFRAFAAGYGLRVEHPVDTREGVSSFKLYVAIPGADVFVSFEGPSGQVFPALLFAKVLTGVEHSDDAFILACRLYDEF
jgi:hypothetical protein